MSITIEMGWWILPALITIISFGIAHIKTPPSRPGHIYNFDFEGLAFNAIAYIVSSAAWLVWALCN